MERVRFCILAGCFLFMPSGSSGQDNGEARTYYLHTGLGNYEAFHAGAGTAGTKGYLEFAAGWNPFSQSPGYRMINGTVGRRILWNSIPGGIKPFLHLKSILWEWEDHFGRYLVLGFAPEFRLILPVGSRFSIAGNAGLIRNLVLSFQRTELNGASSVELTSVSFGVQFRYRL